MEATILALLLTHSAPGSVDAHRLAPAIIAVSAKYNLDPELVTRIILTESRGRANAINLKTEDYGLMQINIKTATAMGVSKQDLMVWQKNIQIGAKVLSQMDRICRYNVGTAKLQGPRLERCTKYERKLASF